MVLNMSPLPVPAVPFLEIMVTLLRYGSSPLSLPRFVLSTRAVVVFISFQAGLEVRALIRVLVKVIFLEMPSKRG
jgi:hypothetical protein